MSAQEQRRRADEAVSLCTELRAQAEDAAAAAADDVEPQVVPPRRTTYSPKRAATGSSAARAGNAGQDDTAAPSVAQPAAGAAGLQGTAEAPGGGPAGVFLCENIR